MSGVERTLGIVVIVVVALGTACSTLPAPRTEVPKAEEAPQDVHGAWANVRLNKESGKKRVTISGELISVDQDSICVRARGSFMHAISWTTVDRVQVVFFNSNEGAAYGIGAAGAVASLAHGWYGALTLPLWLVIGSATGASRNGEAVLVYPQETDDWRELQKYARFPQGAPDTFRPGVDSTVVADSTIAAAPRPVETQKIPTYHRPEQGGSGIVAGGGTFQEGKAVWTAGYHLRAWAELFALAGYTHFDDDVFDMDQWWIGIRVGDPAFIGLKYIYTSQRDEHTNGVSGFAGILKPTSQHVAVGATVGVDDTAGLFPHEQFWWVSVVLQLTLFPFEE